MARYSAVFVCKSMEIHGNPWKSMSDYKIDTTKFNLLPNERLESFWDALWLGIRTFLCFKISNWRHFGVNFHENYGRQWPESEKWAPKAAYRRRMALAMRTVLCFKTSNWSHFGVDYNDFINSSGHFGIDLGSFGGHFAVIFGK